MRQFKIYFRLKYIFITVIVIAPKNEQLPSSDFSFGCKKFCSNHFNSKKMLYPLSVLKSRSSGKYLIKKLKLRKKHYYWSWY